MNVLYFVTIGTGGEVERLLKDVSVRSSMQMSDTWRGSDG
jgi:hypothetical protein